MDSSHRVILKVDTPKYQLLKVEMSDGFEYTINFEGSDLQKVYCYPANNSDWQKVNIDTYGRGLIWASRFEVHIDQLSELTTNKQVLKGFKTG